IESKRPVVASRHSRENGNPDFFCIPGFRLAPVTVGLAGMTFKQMRCKKIQCTEDQMHLRLGFSALSLVGVLFFFLSGSVLGASVNDPAWEKIVAASKKEGKVVVFGPPGPDVRDAFTLGFQKKYPEIEVDF